MRFDARDASDLMRWKSYASRPIVSSSYVQSSVVSSVMTHPRERAGDEGEFKAIKMVITMATECRADVLFWQAPMLFMRSMHRAHVGTM